MIPALTLLLGCQLAGEAFARLFAVSVPGPVMGLALLFIGLQLRDRWRTRKQTVIDIAALDATPLGLVAGVILANLSLLFVPAGVGIVRHAGTLLAHGTGLILALVVSTALSLAVTAIVFRVVARAVNSQAVDVEPESEGSTS
jgi:holin-like protein